MSQVLLCGAAIVTLSMGIRHGFGLWLQPITQTQGWSRENFAFAIAIQNLAWGLAGIFAGMVADKFGAFKVIIAGAGGAAHLPGMLAAKTIVPVLGVPVQSKALSGVDSLHSIVQMPKGIPVATFAIGEAGAANAALFAVAMLANENPALNAKLQAFRQAQTEKVLAMKLPGV